MATKTNSTTPERISYQSPDGRVKVVRHGPRDFALYLDGVCTRSYDYSYQAEHEGGMWLAEQAQQLAADLADEQAEQDAAQEAKPFQTFEKVIEQAATPTVEVKTWQDEAGSYTDYAVDTGLTRVLVGSYGGDKAGIELVIGGACVNQRLDQVLTLADVRQIRDNLNALLADARVQAHQAHIDGLPPIPTVPTQTDHGLWHAPLGSIDGCPVRGTYDGRELMSAALTFQGMRVTFYGGDTQTEYLNTEVGEGLGFPGDMHLREWRVIAALAAQGIVDRLVARFAHYRTAQDIQARTELRRAA